MELFDQCLCCYCFSKETSVKICTWLFIFYCIFNVCFIIFYLGFNLITDYVIVVLIVITIFSLILLLIGLKTKKKHLLIQYNWIFCIYIIGLCINTIIYCVDNGIMLCISDDEKIIKKYKGFLNKPNKNYTDEEVTSYIRKNTISKIICNIVICFISIYYYLTTRDFIRKYVKSMDHQGNMRTSEEINSRKIECIKNVIKDMQKENQNKASSSNNQEILNNDNNIKIPLISN